MDIRLLQKIGRSSFTITLPKDWIIRNKLRAQSRLGVYQSYEGSLIINKIIPKLPGSTYEIDITTIPIKHIGRELDGYYLSGVNELLIKSKTTFTSEIREVIKSRLNHYFGFEIISEDQSKIVLRNFYNNEIPVDTYTLKMSKQILLMFKDLCESIEKRNVDLANDIIARDDEIDRTTLLIERKLITCLKTLGASEPSHVSLVKLNEQEHQAIRMERIADHIVRVAKMLVILGRDSRIEISADTKRKLREAEYYLKLCHELHLTRNKITAHKILNRFSYDKKCSYLTNKIKQKSTIILIIDESIDRIKSYVANIAEGTINAINSEKQSICS